MLLKLNTAISRSYLPANRAWRAIRAYFHSFRQCARDRRVLMGMNDYCLRDIGLTRSIAGRHHHGF